MTNEDKKALKAATFLKHYCDVTQCYECILKKVNQPSADVFCPVNSCRPYRWKVGARDD